MKITFEGSVDEVVEQIAAFIGLTAVRHENEVVRPAVEEKPEKTKRRTRKPKEEPADEKVENDDKGAGDGGTDTPKPRTSRRRTNRKNAVGGDSDAASGGSDKASDPVDSGSGGKGTGTRTRRRRTTKPAETDAQETTEPVSAGLTDADVAKAASAAAAVLTPKVVKDVLKQFGTASVNDLDQNQRREFVDLLDEKVEAANE